ncbi:unnamed protein product [Didymodactylos carnosus]|uniref:Uncharacterized protein n=1 Tax=Didymodactylos carnosus TaxID=1234261 RepID=A0A814RJK4_9BILA|nr:unnamed protein product [Didymodactylos carnosus]CAF1134956.1 unnamed protein product [Didymodactylos carnosus]CAF3503482.1 unnamed protein product [Didymodactylos carnosus]CAF3898736.1 unnamed protein product [Didymodactylos carnosus]
MYPAGIQCRRICLPINVWQALQIVFLILTTATLAATIATTICYRFKRNARFYLALLASFIALPAVCIGLSSLFVFGFSVYNVRFYQNADPKLDWCFYLNIVAVILALIGFILLSIYDCLVKKPVRNDNDTVLNTLEHIDNFQSPIGPFSYQIVTQSKKKTRGFNDKRTKSYIVRPIQQHLPILTPYSSTVAATTNDINRSTYITNHQPLLTPYTSNSTSATHIQQYQSQIPQDYSYQQNTHRLLPSQSTTQINQIHPRQPQQLQLQTQTFEPRLSARQSPSYRPSYWHNTKRSNTSNGYLSEPDYVSRGIMYSPGITIQNTPFQNRYNGIVEQQFLTRGSSGAPPIHREPRVMHYYTGFDYFAALDPTDERELNARRLTVNPSYIQQQEDYIGTM